MDDHTIKIYKSFDYEKKGKYNIFRFELGGSTSP